MADLIPTYRGAVYPWHCDQMGHMNVMWYVGKFDEATWNLFAAMGVTSEYLRNSARGMAAVQQNITYRRELRAGDLVSVSSMLLDIRGKVVKFVHEMRNGPQGDLSAVMVLTAVHIDAVARKSCPFPDTIVERAQVLVGTYDVPA
jgi:acyl-CoA thioester hydrolase